MSKATFILSFAVIAFVITGCSDDKSAQHPDAASNQQQMTIDQKVEHGINTGTPLDMYNTNPLSVFQPYSPWNSYQN